MKHTLVWFSVLKMQLKAISTNFAQLSPFVESKLDWHFGRIASDAESDAALKLQQWSNYNPYFHRLLWMDARQNQCTYRKTRMYI